MTNLSYIKYDKSCTIFLREGKGLNTFEISDLHPNFKKITQLCLSSNGTINDKEKEALIFFLREKIGINKPIKNSKGDVLTLSALGHVEFKHSIIDKTFQVSQQGIIDRLNYLIDHNLSVEAIMNFLHNLYLNPDEDCQGQLYRFLTSNDLPITPDGHFLGYKYVSEDYKDCHTGTFDNQIGARPFMARNKVTKDPNIECAEGLHICSYEYIKTTGSGRIMMVKVNPKNVVSIPYDYNNSKLRCCAYSVVDEFPTTMEVDHYMSKYADFSQLSLKEVTDKLIELYCQYFNLSVDEMSKEIHPLRAIEAYIRTNDYEIDLNSFYESFLKQFSFVTKDTNLQDFIGVRFLSPYKILQKIISYDKN